MGFWCFDVGFVGFCGASCVSGRVFKRFGVFGLGRLAAQRQYFLCRMAPLHSQGCEGAAYV